MIRERNRTTHRLLVEFNDGELISIKWKFIKTVFRYTVDSPDPAIQVATSSRSSR